MCKAFINEDSTYLYYNTGKNGIDRSKPMGFLINNEKIIDIISSISVSEFYAEEEGLKQISYEEAINLYSKLIEYQNTSVRLKQK